MAKDGSKRENCQLKYETRFWWNNIKTLIGAKDYQICGSNKSGREFSLQSKGISQQNIIS
jgi:hypothetical protein